jgi:hypothetical protein
MKSFACLNRVAGYGKKRLPDEKVHHAQQELQTKIRVLRQNLSLPLKAIADQEERLALCIEKERRIRSQSQVVDAERMVDEKIGAVLKSLSSDISQCRREIKRIESKQGKDLYRLRRYEHEWLRLQGKDYVYQIDVELDQIMAYFRIALVNLSSWFLNECLSRHSMSLAKFLHNILLTPAEIELTKDVRRIKLKRNPKDPEGMAELEPALKRLNEFEIKHLDGKRIEFEMV